MTHHMPATVRGRGPGEGGRGGLGLILLQFHFVLQKKKQDVMFEKIRGALGLWQPRGQGLGEGGRWRRWGRVAA